MQRRWTTRGRPPSKGHSAVDTRLLEYLVKISVKHKIDPNNFFKKIVDAWKNRNSKCKKLVIQCREIVRNKAIFLIVSDQKVVAQFPMPESLLKEKAPFKEFVKIIENEKNALMKKKNSRITKYFRIKELKTGMKRVSLKARIQAISKPKLALTRFNDYVMFANATLTDGTGIIKLTLWNGRIDSVSVDDVIEIENASVVAYKGENQLKMGRHSKIQIIGDNGAFKANISNSYDGDK